MTELEKINAEETPGNKRPGKPLPHGYRPGIITAITVLLGFSLSFLKYWGFEAPGEWTLQSILPATTLVLAIVLQITALYRSLSVKDDDEHEYKKTVRWFIASAIMMLIGLASAVWEVS